MKKATSKLDWNRMLGFEQIAGARKSISTETLGPKVGVKVGVKIGAKQGIKA